MAINDRKALTGEAVGRVINSAPVSELLRVYSIALHAELERLTDEELISSLETAGYLDLIEKYTGSGDGEETSDS